MKYRYLLPGLLMLFAVLFIVANIIGIGHGDSTFDFVIYCAYPACLISVPLQALGESFALLSFLVCISAALVQYFVIGLLLDKWLARRRANHERPS